MARLLLVRHGKSEWNALGKWTGWTDVDLSEEGLAEARKSAEAIKDIRIDRVFVSELKRTTETYDEMKCVLGCEDLAPKKDGALNERDYGIHTGKNKWEVKEEIGEEAFQRLRRAWDEPVEGGETMKAVYERIVPYYEREILPDLKAGKNVLVVAHGNSLRALVKYLEGLTNEELASLEFGTGEVFCYDINEEGKVTGKEIRAGNAAKLAV